MDINILIDNEKLIVTEINTNYIAEKYKYKIALIGGPSSGKSSYFYYLCKRKFRKLISIGEEYMRYKISINNIINNISIILISINQTLYIPSYTKGADGIILLLDITSGNEIEKELTYYLQETRFFEYNDIPALLVANKIDLDYDRKITKKEIEDFVKIYREEGLIGYFEVSCKKGINVNKSFEFLIKHIIENKNNRND